MRYRLLALILQLSIVILIFLPIYYVSENMMTGWSFIFAFESGFQEVLASRIVTAVMSIGLIISLVTFVMAWVFIGKKKIEDASIISFNLTLGVGLILLVVQGAYMSYLGYIWIGLIVLTAYIRSLDKK